MLIKTQCNGERPVCKACREQDRTCEFACEPGVTPVAALKRKYKALQAESADEHDLLGFLRIGSDADALKVLEHLRSSDNVRATLHRARNRQDEPDIPALLDNPPVGPAAYQAASQPGPLSTGTSTDITSELSSVYPELSDWDGGRPWALPIEPYVRCCIPLAV